MKFTVIFLTSSYFARFFCCKFSSIFFEGRKENISRKMEVNFPRLRLLAVKVNVRTKKFAYESLSVLRAFNPFISCRQIDEDLCRDSFKDYFEQTAQDSLLNLNLCIYSLILTYWKRISESVTFN